MLKVAWSEDTRVSVERWMHTGDLAHLANLLRDHPFAIGHPAVFKQVQHLHHLVRRTLDAGDYEEGDSIPPDVLPAGTRASTRRALMTLLGAWVEGLLGLGWTLK